MRTKKKAVAQPKVPFGIRLREANGRRNVAIKALQSACAVNDMATITRITATLTVNATDPCGVGFSGSDLNHQVEVLSRNFAEFTRKDGSKSRDLRAVLNHKRSVVVKVQSKLDNLQQRINRKAGTCSNVELRPLIEQRSAVAKDLDDLRSAVHSIEMKVRGIDGALAIIQAEIDRRAAGISWTPIVQKAEAPKAAPKPAVVAKVETIQEPEVKTDPIVLKITHKAKSRTKRTELRAKGLDSLEDLLLGKELSARILSQPTPETIALEGTARQIAALVFEKTGQTIATEKQLSNKKSVLKKAAAVLEDAGFCIAA